MKNVIDSAIDDLHENSADLQDTLLTVGLLFEKYHGNTSALWMSPKAQGFPVEAQDVYRLKTALMSFIENNEHSDDVISALWAMSKLRDNTLKEFLILCLQRQLNQRPDALYQTMIALESIGEKIFEDNESSIEQSDINQKNAKNYLKKIGIDSK